MSQQHANKNGCCKMLRCDNQAVAAAAAAALCDNIISAWRGEGPLYL